MIFKKTQDIEDIDGYTQNRIRQMTVDKTPEYKNKLNSLIQSMNQYMNHTGGRLVSRQVIALAMVMMDREERREDCT